MYYLILQYFFMIFICSERISGLQTRRSNTFDIDSFINQLLASQKFDQLAELVADKAVQKIRKFEAKIGENEPLERANDKQETQHKYNDVNGAHEKDSNENTAFYMALKNIDDGADHSSSLKLNFNNLLRLVQERSEANRQESREREQENEEHTQNRDKMSEEDPNIIRKLNNDIKVLDQGKSGKVIRSEIEPKPVYRAMSEENENSQETDSKTDVDVWADAHKRLAQEFGDEKNIVTIKTIDSKEIKGRELTTIAAVRQEGNKLYKYISAPEYAEYHQERIKEAQDVNINQYAVV
ncbi:uncharacterized protein LOC142985481 [Anticarsia gemmatalis]|uniref:uncharacterized protein LOC142985481 n=1 Tax=Anticarsia gemmatalis TaxID=129554 RepID=UPI003F761143